MDTMIKPSIMLVERLQSIKTKHGVDPRSVSTGECLDLMELMAGYLLGHDKVLEEVAADMAQTMHAVMALRQEVRILRRRARRWATRTRFTRKEHDMTYRNTRRLVPPAQYEPTEQERDHDCDYNRMVVATVVVCLTVLVLGVVTPVVLVWWLIGW